MILINEIDTNISEAIIGVERFISGKTFQGEATMEFVNDELQCIHSLHIQLVGKLHAIHGVVANAENR